MEQITTLSERIATLKDIARSMDEGAIHTRLFPEVDKILALPDELGAASLGEQAAIGRQVREYEQTFEGLGYRLLEQNMPRLGVSPVFQVARAAESFKARLRRRVGSSFELDGERRFEQEHANALTAASLSIGTPPVTADMKVLVARILFGRPAAELFDFVEALAADRAELDRLLAIFEDLVDSSLRYNTVGEEAAFLEEAGEFVNFEGGRLFARVVITESPRRVVDLIAEQLFDKFAPGQPAPVREVVGLDRLDADLVAGMRAEPNTVFVARVTRIPQRLLSPAQFNAGGWRGVIGRLILVDASPAACASNTTLVYTLFPHVARALRDIQTRLGGRPASTQLQLRRILERFTPASLGAIRRAIEARLAALEAEGALSASIEELRVEDWRRRGLSDALALIKLRRLIAFLERIASSDEAGRRTLGEELRRGVVADWMRYFYKGLPAGSYWATVLPGGGRGALAMAGAFHRSRVAERVEGFCAEELDGCRRRLEEVKRAMQIPASSTDEIEAAEKQSRLRARSPGQWQPGEQAASLPDHLARTMAYRLADAAGRLARRTRAGVDRAAFGNVTGGAAALFKRAMSASGFGALHGRLEDVVGEPVSRADRKLRNALAPLQGLIRSAQRSMDELKGELDPIAIGEVEATLKLVEQRRFYPSLILPAMAWSYADVFPEKDFPAQSIVRVPLNDRHEMDAEALLTHLERLRYLFRRFPEVFDLLCSGMLLLINSPHNPTGVVYRRETILKLLQIASEYGLTVLDDNSYHKLVTRAVKAREGDACVAQLYERHRDYFAAPVRIITAGATTKGLQGAGDRTGLLHANVAEAVRFAEERASDPHLMSLYLTRLKLEVGLAAKRVTGQLERLAARLLEPASAPWQALSVLLEGELEAAGDESFPGPVFEELLDGYERLLRLRSRGASLKHLSECLSELVGGVKSLRLERRLRADVERRLSAARAACARAFAGGEPASIIEPQGAFYLCVKLCEDGDDRGLSPFLQALARHRNVDATAAGGGFVRLSLGGALAGDADGYAELGRGLEVKLRLLLKYWRAYAAEGRDLPSLEARLAPAGEDALAAIWRDLGELVEDGARPEPERGGSRVEPSERGVVYCIEEGRSLAEKVVLELGAGAASRDLRRPAAAVCDSVEQLLASRAFRVVYRRQLKMVFRGLPALAELSLGQVENQYGPLMCQAAYRDRQLIDDAFRALMRAMYERWHGSGTIRSLAARLEDTAYAEKLAALHGINAQLNALVNELAYAFECPEEAVRGATAFELGYEVLRGIAPHPGLPPYLRSIIAGCAFAGATAPLNGAPRYVTGAAKRVSDHRYQFNRRDGEGADREGRVSIEVFRRRLAAFAELTDFSHYIGKAVQVGPFKMLLLAHQAGAHLINDELRLFPQIEAVQTRGRLDALAWDGVLLFGIPSKVMGDSFKSGYILDACEDGAPLPTAWVAREDATDYVGFLKKSLLTMHNERVKALGGLPVHGAMIVITFKNGLRKTLVFSADSGTGKSEMITAMMEQLAEGVGQAAEVRRIDILAGDMLSLWRGEDGQIYAFGTETGDFMRLTDITESWQRRFGDLLKRGSFSNLEHPKNPRVTIPGICDAKKVLSPTRVNGFFYINNYAAVRGGCVELSEDPHQVLKQTLVRGLRKNKGTSGDQPSLRAGLEFAGEAALVTRFRHSIDELLEWQPREVDGRALTCLVYRDGAEDPYQARDLVTLAFKGRSFRRGEAAVRITGLSFDVLRNLYWLTCDDGERAALDRGVYDQIYEPLVSTFCGNPFVDPRGMDRSLSAFAEAMRGARVHTGVIKTQLARGGYEFSGPAQAARDVVAFLLEDEEVNARFQRNKGKVHAAMQRTFEGVLAAGANLPVELEGYNLLRLEEHESTHVAFVDEAGAPFTLSTPYYRYERGARRVSPELGEARPGSEDGFVPALALPEMIAAIADICANPDLECDLSKLEVDPEDRAAIRYWSSVEELTYQVLLVNGVINLGSSEAELTRFPYEVRKARYIAEQIIAERLPERAPRLQATASINGALQ